MLSVFDMLLHIFIKIFKMYTIYHRKLFVFILALIKKDQRPSSDW